MHISLAKYSRIGRLWVLLTILAAMLLASTISMTPAQAVDQPVHVGYWYPGSSWGYVSWGDTCDDSFDFPQGGASFNPYRMLWDANYFYLDRILVRNTSGYGLHFIGYLQLRDHYGATVGYYYIPNLASGSSYNIPVHRWMPGTNFTTHFNPQVNTLWGPCGLTTAQVRG